MRKLWLHIGAHKTGTTTLQNSLSNANRKGKLGSLTYVHSESPPNSNNAIAIQGDGENMRWKIKPAVLEESIPESGDCIISSERFFWLDSKKTISPLAAVLKDKFDEIKVVAYLRRQDSLALSFRKTAITIPPARRFFGNSISALPVYLPHMDRYFDYFEKLSAWESVFGRENIIVRKYDLNTLIGNDTVADFSHVIGHQIDPIKKRANKSWSRNQLLAGFWLHSKGYPQDNFLNILKNLENNGEKLLPSRADAIHFMDRFKKSNLELAKKYAPNGDPSYFDDDFSKYPEIGNDDISNMSAYLKEIEGIVLGEIETPTRRQHLPVKKGYFRNLMSALTGR
jgi:hypothetical protein